MLGQQVRETRIKKNLTQAKLARLAGVSRRHLAALEKGANVSVLVLKKVAGVLDLKDIQLGDLSIHPGDPDESTINLPLLTDSIREARAEAYRLGELLSTAEGILGGEELDNVVVGHFPTLVPRRIERRPAANGNRLADASGLSRFPISAEIRQGERANENVTDTALIPATMLENGELLFRARGDELRAHGIEDGDLLVVELRTTGRANNAELVIAKVGDAIYVGRWWSKHGRKALMSDGFAEVTTGPSARSLKVMAAINTIIRDK
ncbi:MAG: Helix-turn-helix domain [Acidobacteriota bacterium]|jgi:transcriptional regulator with XRE-family HTH domain|nr:Helix-turn-helix domain [Acidobacteriota bacterium]